jgi:hypothetical protein
MPIVAQINISVMDDNSAPYQITGVDRLEAIAILLKVILSLNAAERKEHPKKEKSNLVLPRGMI